MAKQNKIGKPGWLITAIMLVLLLGAGFVNISCSGDDPLNNGDNLLAEYETGDKQFERREIGDKIVYFHQRTIDDAIVEGDYIVYQFDKDTKQLLDKKIHLRKDLPEHLPSLTITEKQAESIVKGKIQSTKLYFISAESDVFPIKPAPENPCWVVRSIDNDNMDVTIIDAVTGEVVGYGVPPPPTNGSEVQEKGF